MQSNWDMNNQTMSEIKLSYVITTRNKLLYLKEVMKRLLENVQADEEIVVADGESTDGTVEYLKDLYEQGKIHQFISEPDKGEAHGYNKCLLMARGELIKIITDDDTFYYPEIQKCKHFMLKNRDMDVVSGNTAGISLEQPNRASLLTECENNYRDWQTNGDSVWFIGLPLMIRRSSLSLTGLFFTGFIQVDTEYSLRITSLKHVNIAWNTALLAIRIDNPNSNFRSFSQDEKSFEERDKMWYFYNRKHRERLIALAKREVSLSEFIKKILRPIKREIEMCINRTKERIGKSQAEFKEEILIEHYVDSTSEIEKAFCICDYFLKEFNSKKESKILCKSTIQ